MPLPVALPCIAETCTGKAGIVVIDGAIYTAKTGGAFLNGYG